MTAIIIFGIIALVVGFRTWIELRNFDRISGNSARARAQTEGSMSFPFNKFYFF